MVPENTRLADKPRSVADWAALSDDQRKMYARQAEVFAGFVEFTDYEVGRLLDAIEERDFREDLYHRLNEFKIEISPLRVRTEEIPQFAHHFLNQANAELEKEVQGFEERTMELLSAYPWPGNLRELKNVVKRSVLLSRGELVSSEALPGEVINYQHGEKNFKSLNESENYFSKITSNKKISI